MAVKFGWVIIRELKLLKVVWKTHFYRAVLRRARLCDSMSSVRPSETLRYDLHTFWNTSKIIWRPNSLRHLLPVTPIWAIWCNWNTPKFGWNRDGSRAPKTCNISETVQEDQCYCDGLLGSRIRAFDWCQNQWPWMTLNGRNVTLVEMKKNYGAHQKNLNEDRFILSAAKCRPMILVSRNADIRREGRQLSNDSKCHALRPLILL